MKSKVLLAIAIITVLSLGVIYYLAKGNNTKKLQTELDVTPTPTTTDTETSNAVAESSTIVVKADGKTEKVIFHNATGFTFASYADAGVTDKVAVSLNGTEVLMLGVNWVGYTQGSLPLIKVVTIKNQYIGNLYRATGGGLGDRGYILASEAKISGKCTGNGDAVQAPCTNNDQISNASRSRVFSYLAFCSDEDSIAKCDELMSGLEITK